MFAADPHRIFLMDRLPKVLTGSRSASTWLDPKAGRPPGPAAASAARFGRGDTRPTTAPGGLAQSASLARRRANGSSTNSTGLPARAASRAGGGLSTSGGGGSGVGGGSSVWGSSISGPGSGGSGGVRKARPKPKAGVLDMGQPGVGPSRNVGSLGLGNVGGSNASIWELADLVFEQSEIIEPQARSLDSTMLSSTAGTWAAGR
eukprot:SAG22_NODE_284_length_13033_cov_21.541828_11_plen_204_part_00